MLHLEPSQIRDFLNRFVEFHDALLVDVRVSLREPRYATIVVHAVDCTNEGAWAEVTIRVERLEMFLWREHWQDVWNMVIKLPVLITILDGRYFLAIQVHGNGDLYVKERQLIDEASLCVAGTSISYSVTLL
jgi:hypothetical protein